MKRTVLIFSLVLLISSCKESAKVRIERDITIIPAPQQVSFFEGTFEMSEKTAVKAGNGLINSAEQLRDYLCPSTGYLLPVNKSVPGGNTIELVLMDDLSSLGEEGYKINISDKKVLISAYTEQGIFWGIQTLRQLFPHEILRKAATDNIKWSLPCADR